MPPSKTPGSEKKSIEAFELMCNLGKHMMRRITNCLREEGLNPADEGVLRELSKGDASRLSDISRRTGIPPNTLSGIVDRLEALGLVRRVRSLEDRRVIELHATDDLKKKSSDWRAAHMKLLVPLFEALSDEDLSNFIRIMKILYQQITAQGNEDYHETS